MKKKLEKKVVCELLGISEKSYYRWKENRKIFALLEKYYTTGNLEEFLEKGAIADLDVSLEIANKIDDVFDDSFWKTPQSDPAYISGLNLSGDLAYKLILLPMFYQHICNIQHGVFFVDEKKIKNQFFDFVSETKINHIQDDLKIQYLKLLNNIDGFVFKLLVLRYSTYNIQYGALYGIEL
ncbi:MAG: hypothetical protein RBT59_08855 [Arcobacteraceae bacterium]|nr:hypothetical protein [Arcobacteraceae bacterium]